MDEAAEKISSVNASAATDVGTRPPDPVPGPGARGAAPAAYHWAFLGAAILVMGLAMGALEAASFRQAGAPRHFNDSRGYLRVSSAPLLSRELWMGDRPPVAPLLYKLCGQDEATIVRVQSGLSVACWLSLAVALGVTFESRVMGAAAAAAVGAFSLVVPANQWNWVLLSESLSLSLLALVVAASLLLALAIRQSGRPAAAWMWLWGLSCALFALVRDANVYVLAAGWGVLACWTLIAAFGRRRPGVSPARGGVVACLGVLAGVVLGAQLMASRSDRWELPFLNVLLRRVLPDEETYALFAGRYGMPRNPLLERFAGLYGWNGSGDGRSVMVRVLGDDPQLADVRGWIGGDGKSAYQRFLLLDRPGHALRAAMSAFAKQVAGGRGAARYGTGAGVTPWTRALSRVLYPQLSWPLASSLLVVAVAALLAVASPAARVAAVGAMLLVGSAWVHAFVSFHGDTSNVDRHLMPCGVQVRLGGLFLAFALADRTVAMARRWVPARRAPASAEADPP